MFMVLKVSVAFCFTILVQTVANHDVDLCHDVILDNDVCPSSTTEDPTCSYPALQLPKCQCDCSKGDCASFQQSLTSCGYVVFYGDQKDLKFCSDDTFYQARCMDQIDCTENIQCFITCCLQGKGANYMKRVMRAIQYEILSLCHPDADPKAQTEFKHQTECNNAIWPGINRCVHDYHWNLSASIKKDRVDIPRFCCTFAGLINCFYAAAHVECCTVDQRLFMKNLPLKYGTYAISLLCGEEVYDLHSPPCCDLPPVDRRGPPPPNTLQIHINIARVLMNSTNEECH